MSFMCKVGSLGLMVGVMLAGCGGSAAGTGPAPGQGGGDSGVLPGDRDSSPGQVGGYSGAPPGTTVVDCSELGRVACGEAEQCLRIQGRRYDPVKKCFEDRRFVACVDDTQCGDGVSYAFDEAGYLWEFPSTCRPSGWPIGDLPSDAYTWSKCGTGGLHPDEPTADCWKFGPEACAANEDCFAKWGDRPNGVEGCYEFGKQEFVACDVDRVQMCDDGFFCAQSPSGDWLRFSHGCTPTGWPSEFPCAPSRQLPYCADGVVCSKLSPSECYSSWHCMGVTGQPVNEADHCLENTEVVVACMERGPCANAEEYARGPSGDVYRFTYKCSPDGWTAVHYESVVGWCGKPVP